MTVHSLSGYRRLCPFILILASVLLAGATTRRVPTEYATIQSALDALMEGDTVLVDTGLYAEALVAPALFFVLQGNVIPDTGDYPRPVIDPSSLPNPGSRTCLKLDSASAVVEDVEFRNRSPMYPPTDSVGGVWYWRGDMTLRRCIFDSTFYALCAYQGDVSVSDCEFRHVSGYGVLCYGSALATDCDFQYSDSTIWAQLTARSGSRIERCRFAGNHNTRTTINLAGDDIQVRDCVFGPGVARGLYRVYFGCTNSIFEGNRLENWDIGQDMFWFATNTPTSVQIRNNVLRNCFQSIWYPPEGSLNGFHFSDASGCDTCLTEFNHNIIENCSGFHGVPGVLVDGGHPYVHNNRFTNISPMATRSLVGSWALRYNLFYGNEVALESFGGLANAIWNWWGDPTGPYCVENPDGQGDSISGNIDFDPWYTDTTFFADSAPDESGAHAVRHYDLYPAYPNPFNPVAQLVFELDRTALVRLEVYNLSGQKVRELVDRRYEAGQHTIRFDARELPSGIYFAQMRAGEFVKTEKMVFLK